MASSLSTTTSSFARAAKHAITYNSKITPPRQAWVENFIGQDKKLLAIVDLHPEVFSVFPKLHHLSSTIRWQQEYRKINYVSMPTRNELPGGTKKPWPQKGSGRARHGSVNSPIFLFGGWAKGPRGPTTGFKLHPFRHMVSSMTTMLSIKLAQDDIKIVDSIDSFKNEDPVALEAALSERGWGPSALIVDKCDVFPEQLVAAAKSLTHINFMPTIGINPLSMCKHETMIITLDALRDIEDKLLLQLSRSDFKNLTEDYNKP